MVSSVSGTKYKLAYTKSYQVSLVLNQVIGFKLGQPGSKPGRPSFIPGCPSFIPGQPGFKSGQSCLNHVNLVLQQVSPGFRPG